MVLNDNFVWSRDCLGKMVKVYLPEVIKPMASSDRIVKQYIKDLSDAMDNPYAKPVRCSDPLKALAFSRCWAMSKRVLFDPRDFDSSRTCFDWLLEEAKTHYGVEPFVPCVFITISPDWKGKVEQADVLEKFKNVLDNYAKACDRYSAGRFVLECGSDGDFIHAHFVLKFNNKIQKSVETHIAKGNHRQELLKAWKKEFKGMKGIEGCVKGKFEIAKNVIRTQIILTDKLNYLIEEKKPDGHTNKFIIQDGYWGFGDF